RANRELGLDRLRLCDGQSPIEPRDDGRALRAPGLPVALLHDRHPLRGELGLGAETCSEWQIRENETGQPFHGSNPASGSRPSGFPSSSASSSPFESSSSRFSLYFRLRVK